jgi:hypothetical protein
MDRTLSEGFSQNGENHRKDNHRDQGWRTVTRADDGRQKRHLEVTPDEK